MPYADYARNKIIDHANGKTAWTMPTVYVGLFTTKPTGPGNAGTEMSGGAYARTALGSSMGAASSGLASSTANVDVTCNTGTVVAFGFWDAASAGNMILFDDILQSVSLESNVFPTTGEGADVIALAQVDVRNVVVKNNLETVTYTEGTDYYVEYESGRVVRITGGGIASGDTVKVSYDYANSRSVVNNDILRLSAGNLKTALIGFK